MPRRVAGVVRPLPPLPQCILLSAATGIIARLCLLCRPPPMLQVQRFRAYKNTHSFRTAWIIMLKQVTFDGCVFADNGGSVLLSGPQVQSSPPCYPLPLSGPQVWALSICPVWAPGLGTVQCHCLGPRSGHCLSVLSRPQVWALSGCPVWAPGSVLPALLSTGTLSLLID